jgi:hypothetical protein
MEGEELLPPDVKKEKVIEENARTSEVPPIKSVILLNKIKDIRAERNVEADNFETFSVQNPQEFLEWATVNGYVFHGSTRKTIGELVPQQANDLAKESGNRDAVYMTRNPLLAEFTALTGGKDVGVRQNKCFMQITDSKEVRYPQTPEFRVGKPDEVETQGYVYIFDREKQVDEEVGGECLVYEPVKPIAVIRVKREDFKYPILLLLENRDTA